MKSLVITFILMFSPLVMASTPTVTVYRSATCGCCGKWAKYMEDNGFKVVQKSVDNVSEYKKKFGVPSEMSSCHTAKIGDVFVEGHVPANVVKKFLKQKPKGAIGIAVPEMPIGSPGMEQGARKDKYTVYSVDKAGKVSSYQQVN